MRWIYRIHKWVGVSVGLILLMWIVTGLAVAGGEGELKPLTVTFDPRSATVSPAQAVAVVTGDSGFGAVRQVALDRLGATIVYRVSGEHNHVALVDAATGTRFTVDSAQAVAAAQANLPDAPVTEVHLVRRKDGLYPNGPLPAWRVRFDDRDQTVFHVGQDGGLVSRTTSGAGFHRLMMSLHTFAILRRVPVPPRGIHLIFLATGIVALGTVITGYYLSLPKKWRPGKGSAQETR